VGLGLVLLSGIRGITAGIGYDRVGPRFFPYVVAAGFIVLGSMLVISAIARPRIDDGAATSPIAGAPASWAPAAWLSVAFVVFLVLIERAGFVVASGLQFWLVARGFGSRRPVRDAIVAAGVSAGVYVGFSNMLGLTLPGFMGR
jgi:putative tricarboxylic transport membrane protein